MKNNNLRQKKTFLEICLFHTWWWDWRLYMHGTTQLENNIIMLTLQVIAAIFLLQWQSCTLLNSNICCICFHATINLYVFNNIHVLNSNGKIWVLSVMFETRKNISGSLEPICIWSNKSNNSCFAWNWKSL